MRAHENPFRTSRVTALAYRGEGQISRVLEALRAQGLRGAIVGPEGSGKSTLLHQIADELDREGHNVIHARFDHPSVLAGVLRRETVVCVDGAERIPQPIRTALVACVRRVIITAHRPVTGIPTAARCTTTPGLLQALIAELGIDLAPEEVARRFARSHGNLRAALAELYDDAATWPAPFARDTRRPCTAGSASR